MNRKEIVDSSPLALLPDLERARVYLKALEILIAARISHYEEKFGILIRDIDVRRVNVQKMSDESPKSIFAGVKISAIIKTEEGE